MIRIRGLQPIPLLQAISCGLRTVPKPKHLFLCVADHYEPDWGKASPVVQEGRVQRWVENYPKLFGSIHDSRGRAPQHSFFYPAEVYQASQLDLLKQLVNQGFGECEVHLHHDGDTSESLEAFLTEYCKMIHERHGFLQKDSRDRIRYGFIHGNWALDNSHPDGRWCGVNDELSVLLRTGCYADFTMPAAPHAAQTSTINQIYYAIDDPHLPKSHDRGVRAAVGTTPSEDKLLLIQGPLLLALRRETGKRLLQLENGNLSASQPPSRSRIGNWLRACVQVKGREDWSFIKLHTHGAPEENANVLLGDAMIDLHHGLAEWSLRTEAKYYYVTAREMAALVHQAEEGKTVPDFAAISK